VHRFSQNDRQLPGQAGGLDAPRQWVAHCQSVGNGEKALITLGRYLYRGVIREQAILACGNGRVSFRYRSAKANKVQKRALAGADFLWLILQHLLPKGFRRARYFGFLHANCKRRDGLAASLCRSSIPAASRHRARSGQRCVARAVAP
jgi:hypothetical protein